MDNHNSISYDKNWKKVSEPVRYRIPEQKPVERQDNNKERKSGRPILTIIQIIICLVVVLTAYILKSFGVDLYNTVKSAYETEINNEIILNPYENSLDKLFDVPEK